ncbi:hypothetical protein CBF34_05525 [Vagococcus penaei]|uniref:Uncharacterized protein n=1 Tax=Vagococcus penaei TaxID=633807 RepID=A0A1Q2D3X2_9ENTE|nr:DUF1827 family protein [Vagococcus penaei]AQP53005.1 hypothetical protein BW732_01365 [Vagococcus penaei]RSU02535.1 hypothetical protein CBF34_05525 [Vagococcus penaei]
MKLVDVTNSYGNLVSKQLENTDANYVRVYSFGKTLVVHSEANTHTEIVIVNKSRDIKDFEIDHVLSSLLHTSASNPRLETIKSNGLVELSLKHVPVKEKKDD